MMVVGTKADLRDDPKQVKELHEQGERPYTKEQGDALAAELKAVGYMECSAMMRTGLNEVFETAIRFVLRDREARRPAPAEPKPEKKKCVLL